jgi:hypothetical protein
MLQGKIYLQFLKEGKCQEAHDALEKACEEKDAYALFLKAQFIYWECLTYTRDKKYANELEKLSVSLGCPWYNILRGKHSEELLATIDKDNDPLWGYFKHLGGLYVESIIYLRQSAKLGHPISQYVLTQRTVDPERTYWVNKAMELNHLDSFKVAGRNCLACGEWSKGAKLLIQGNDLDEIAVRVKPFRVEFQEDRLRELCMYGEFACTTKTPQPSWLNNDNMTIVHNLYKGCQRILHQSLVAWFIICKRFFVSKDIRILIAKLIIESKCDAYLYGYRLKDNGEVCFKTVEPNKKIRLQY